MSKIYGQLLICWQDFSSKLEIKKVMRGAELQGTSAQGKDDANLQKIKIKYSSFILRPWPIQLS